MAFVLDASAAVSWAFADENPLDAALAYERIRTEQAVVPRLWWFEIRNALIVAERRGRISVHETTLFLHSLLRHRITEDRVPIETDVMTFARRHRLTIYDAAYLELAYRTGLHLATLDAALSKAAELESVPLVA